MSAIPPADDKPGVPIAPPLLFVLPFALLLVLEWLVPTRLLAPGLRWTVGAAFLVIGASLAGSGFATQKRAGTDPIPFHPTTKIVTKGPYRITRNPMYLGFALATLGLAFLADSAWTLLAVPAGLVLVDRFVIVREERYLERKFGPEYLAYKRRVRRWL